MKRYIASFCLLTISVLAYSQGIKSSVEVTNDFKAADSQTVKSSVQMSVPDSLMEFDYKFDYSVFDSPYRGSYDFHPYEMKLSPLSGRMSDRRFFARAGAGYSFHPEFELLWAPRLDGRFSFDLSANAHGFAGTYKRPSYDSAAGSLSGSDLAAGILAQGKWSLPGIEAGFFLGYDGSFTSGRGLSTSFNTGALGAYVESKRTSGTFFYYRAAISYRGGADNTSYARFHSNNFRLGGAVGAVIKSSYKLISDIDFENDNSAGQTFFVAAVKPKLDFDFNGIKVKAGVNLSFSNIHPVSLFPDVYASYDFLKGRMGLFASITGGDSVQSYYLFKQMNHRYTPECCNPGITRVKYDLGAGFKGVISDKFTFRLAAGFRRYSDSPLESVNDAVDGFEKFIFCDYMKTYADVMMHWSSEHVDADFNGEYATTMFDGACDVFALPKFSGNGSLSFNLRHRIFFGLDAVFQTERKPAGAAAVSMPSWIDMGLSMSYRTSGKWGYWGRIGNLLNNTICHSQLYFEKGVYLTLGVSYSF